MLKKTIEYEGFDGEKYTEDFYFHFSKAELVEMELSYDGGMQTWINNIIAAEDGKVIMAEFKKLILGAYGKKSPDGKRFVKTDALREEFYSSEAYSVLFMELVTDAGGAASEFSKGILPQDMAEDAAKVVGVDLTVVPDETTTPELKNDGTNPPLPPLPPVSYISRSDLAVLDGEDFKRAMDDVNDGRVRITE